MKVLEADDLEVDSLVTVHSTKMEGCVVPCMGLAFQVKAINLPYVCCVMYGNSVMPTILDVRFLNLMRISPEYANACAGKL